MESRKVRDRKRTPIVKKVVIAAALAMSAWTLVGCNTVEGAGRDVKSLGKGVEETAQDAKN